MTEPLTQSLEHESELVRLEKPMCIIKTPWGSCMPAKVVNKSGESILAAFLSRDWRDLNEARYLENTDIRIQRNGENRYKVSSPDLQPKTVAQIIKDRKREGYRCPVLAVYDRSNNYEENSKNLAARNSSGSLDMNVERSLPFLPHITEVVASVARTARTEGMIAAGWVFMPMDNN